MIKLIILTLTILVMAVSAASASSDRFCAHSSNGLGVWAIGPTSCSFAKATANTYLAQHRAHIRVYSHVTHRSYNMWCRTIKTYDSPYLLCTGANNARVEIRS